MKPRINYNSPLRFVENFIDDNDMADVITITKEELIEFARKIHNYSGRYWKKLLLKRKK